MSATVTMTTPITAQINTITHLAGTRHSTRAYKSDPIPRDILEECFKLAQRSTSNSNLQPWRVHVAEGEALQRLETALMAAFDAGEELEVLPIPEPYKKYRSALGHEMYGPNGYDIPRGAKQEMHDAVKRNFTFFGAPAGLIISLDKALAPVDVLSVGIYLQTLLFLLQEHGIGHCVDVCVAGYPKQIHQELGIPDDMNIMCGVAIGYEDDSQKINHIKQDRDDWREVVTFLSE